MFSMPMCQKHRSWQLSTLRGLQGHCRPQEVCEVPESLDGGPSGTHVHLSVCMRYASKPQDETATCIILHIHKGFSEHTQNSSSPQNAKSNSPGMSERACSTDSGSGCTGPGVVTLTRLGPPDNENKVRKVRLKLPCIHCD